LEIPGRSSASKGEERALSDWKDNEEHLDCGVSIDVRDAGIDVRDAGGCARE
jgi:hypothetical protein